MKKSVNRSKAEKSYALQQVQSEPAHVLALEPILIYDIATIINFAYQTNLEPTKSGSVPKRLTKKLAPLLNVRVTETGDVDQYIDTIFSILTHEKILTLKHDVFNEDKIHVIVGPHLAKWRKYSLVQQAQELLEYWQDREFGATSGGLYGDSLYYAFQGGYYGYASYDQKWSRQLFLQHISKSQFNTWYTLESFFQVLWQQEQLAQKDTVPFYPRRTFLEFDDWLHYSASRYLAMLTGMVSDLGLIEVGYDEAPMEGKVPLHSCRYRLTSLAQAVLNGEDDPATPGHEKSEAEAQHTGEVQGHYIIQPNFDVMLLTPDMPALYQVLPFTQVKRVNQASTLQLSKVSVQKGLEAGLDIEQIIEVLTQRSSAPIAQNVLYTLREWADQHKVAKVALSYVIEAPDEVTVARMLNNATFKKLEARQLTPCIFQINANTNIQTLKTALDKEGIQLKYYDL